MKRRNKTALRLGGFSSGASLGGKVSHYRGKQFVLGFYGIRGDKNTGIQQLEVAADHGHYLRPFAKILLALAALREKKTEVARAQLKELAAEFPANPLFTNELANLNVSPGAAIPPR
jgi:hypothetical protein